MKALSSRQIWKECWSPLRCEFLEQSNRACEEAVACVHQPQIEGGEAPVRHDLDEPPVAQQLRLYERGKITYASAREQCGRETGIVIHREVRVKCQGLLLPSVHEAPDIHGLPEREGQQAVLEQVLRFLRRLATGQIGRTCDKLVPVRQDLASDE